jgi:hypothetical protein
MARVTDFFIAGAPKCGTTALFDYLASHPGVYIPPCKEPNYFCSDLGISGARTLSDYQALFVSAPPGALTGDASSMYLYSEVAIQRIMAHNAAAKIIVMLRHPVEAALSLYGALRSHGHEDAPDFERAWRLQAERLKGRELPPRWPDPKTLQYGAIYRYAPQLQRLLGHVARPHCLFLVYEEFFAEPSRQFGRVLEFLHLPADPARKSFPTVNPTLGTRSHRLQQVLAAPPSWVTTLAMPLQRLARAAHLHPRQALQRLNQHRTAKATLQEPFRRELENYFAADIAATEALLSRRLWPPALASRDP